MVQTLVSCSIAKNNEKVTRKTDQIVKDVKYQEHWKEVDVDFLLNLLLDIGPPPWRHLRNYGDDIGVDTSGEQCRRAACSSLLIVAFYLLSIHLVVEYVLTSHN